MSDDVKLFPTAEECGLSINVYVILRLWNDTSRYMKIEDYAAIHFQYYAHKHDPNFIEINT